MADNRKDKIHSIAEKVVAILDSFGVKVKPVRINDYSSYVTFEVELSSGTRLSKIIGLSDDLALYLGVDSVTVTPIHGKAMVVGIRVPMEPAKSNSHSKERLFVKNLYALRLDVLYEDCDYFDRAGYGIATIDNRFSKIKTRELLSMNIRDIITFFIFANGEMQKEEVSFVHDLFSLNISANDTATYLKNNYQEMVSKSTPEQIVNRIPLILQIFVTADNALVTEYHKDLYDYIISTIRDVCFADNDIAQNESILLNRFMMNLDNYIQQHYIKTGAHTWNDRLMKTACDLFTDNNITTSPALQNMLGVGSVRASNIISYLCEESILQSNDNGSFSISKPYIHEKDTVKHLTNKVNNQNLAADELNSLIGLHSVKQEVSTLINMVRMRKIREEKGLRLPAMSNHLVFYGNPGTGKTTVARLLAKIYCQLGILSKGHLVEAERSDLVAGYVGQTAIKTKEIIEKAKGGILFIDEAYTLSGKSDTDYGREAVDTLLKNMEDNRADLIVIVAGYKEPMQAFLNMNPGLRSRFNKFINFEDYSADELYDIFCGLCKSYDYILDNDTGIFLREYFNNTVLNKPTNFSNGRFVRNCFEKIIENQSNRLANVADYTDIDLRQIKLSDIQQHI